MKLNYTSEVQRLSRAVLGNENAVDASAVVQHVDELANRKPTSCQRGANSPKRGRHQPRKCWDSTTGFGAGHVHAATSKPKAYSKRIVLDEVQRRVPHCDVYLALRRVTEGFGVGSRLMGDDGDDRLKEDTDAALLLRGPSPRRSTLLTRNLRRHQHPSKRTRASLASDGNQRRRLLFSSVRKHWGNNFVDSLPEQAASDGRPRLPETDAARLRCAWRASCT